jgi:tetratricopeptide (TPR) repeat protein
MPLIDFMTLDEALELHKSRNHEAAEQAYREYLLASPEDAAALHLLGVLRHQRGDSIEAEALIRSAIAKMPEDAQYYLSLGGVQMQLGQTGVAQASFETALALDPNYAEAHALLGHLALHDGNDTSAENRFKIGRRVDEDDPHVLLGLGGVYLARNDFANALKFLTRAAERKPDDAAIQSSLGQALFGQGTFAFAEQAFQNALRLNPGYSLAKLFLARSKMRQDKLEEAREVFAELAESNSQVFGANAGLGDIARKHGQPLRALKFYRRALAIDPAHPGAINACALCMELLGDPASAVGYLATGLEHAPDADELRRPLAILLDKLGRNAEAEQVRQVLAARGRS